MYFGDYHCHQHDYLDYQTHHHNQPDNHQVGRMAEVEFVNAVTAGGSVKFLPAV